MSLNGVAHFNGDVRIQANKSLPEREFALSAANLQIILKFTVLFWL